MEDGRTQVTVHQRPRPRSWSPCDVQCCPYRKEGLKTLGPQFPQSEMDLLRLLSHHASESGKEQEQREEVSPQMQEGRPADPERKAVSWVFLGSTATSQTHREFPATAKSQRPEGAATEREDSCEE